MDDYWKPSGKRGTFHSVRWIDAVDPDDRGSYASGWVKGPRRAGLAAGPGTLSLKPGESITFARFIAVSHSPAAAVSEVLVYADPKTALINGQLNDPKKRPVNTATIEITKGNAKLPCYPFGQGEEKQEKEEGSHRSPNSDFYYCGGKS